MNMDYSEAFYLLDQDAKKERNKKAKQAVHDNLYNKGYRDGSLATCHKVSKEIDQAQYAFMADKDYDEGIRFGLMLAYQIIDKYKAERSEE